MAAFVHTGVMPELVKEKHADYIAKTLTLLNDGRVTMGTSNCSASNRVENVALERIRQTEKDIKRITEAGDFPKLDKDFLKLTSQCPSCGDLSMYSKVTGFDYVDARTVLGPSALTVAIMNYADVLEWPKDFRCSEDCQQCHQAAIHARICEREKEVHGVKFVGMGTTIDSERSENLAAVQGG